jgi:hypothetical protein
LHGLRFAYNLALLDGGLTTTNILFDSDHRIQTVDFQRIILEVDESESEKGAQLGGFLGEG